MIVLTAERTFDGGPNLQAIKSLARRFPGRESLQIHVGTSRLTLGPAWTYVASPGCLTALSEFGTVEVRRVRTLPPHIESKIARSDESECWIWTGWRKNGDYGKVYFREGSKLAHRVVYELLVGPIPAGLGLDHVKARRRPRLRLQGRVLGGRARRDRRPRRHRRVLAWP